MDEHAQMYPIPSGALSRSAGPGADHDKIERFRRVCPPGSSNGGGRPTMSPLSRSATSKSRPSHLSLSDQ